jgi:hypothetical protein
VKKKKKKRIREKEREASPMPTTPTSLLMITPQLSSAIYMQMMMGARALLSPIYI